MPRLDWERARGRERLKQGARHLDVKTCGSLGTRRDLEERLRREREALDAMPNLPGRARARRRRKERIGRIEASIAALSAQPRLAPQP